MRITTRAMWQKRNELNQQILHCRSELSKIFPAVFLQSIRAKIQDTYSKLFNNFLPIKAHKLDQLSVLKLLGTRRLKTSKLWLPFQKIYHHPIQKNLFSVWA